MKSWISVVKKGIQDRKFVANFFTEYKDITFYLGLFLSLSDILNLSLSCKQINVLLCSDQFWRQRYLQDFGICKAKSNLKQAYIKYIRHNMTSYIYVVGVTSIYHVDTMCRLCPTHDIYFTFDRKKAMVEAKRMEENISKFYEHGCKVCNPEDANHYVRVNALNISCDKMFFTPTSNLYFPIKDQSIDSDTEDPIMLYWMMCGVDDKIKFENFKKDNTKPRQLLFGQGKNISIQYASGNCQWYEIIKWEESMNQEKLFG
uniref:F-box-like protein n=1 Tax=Marseillevirus LCMAC102 TaxID=2506603 RepID=A0A481YUF1_9VIRU|nr:MAG: F-box-like protein [Marseillevirus LCMAC102]